VRKIRHRFSAVLLAAFVLAASGGCKGDCTNSVQPNGPGKNLVSTHCK
jgi:hypothetical protein